MSNRNEVFAGTHPVDPDSVFAISSFTTGNMSTQVQWMSVPGRTYRVEYSDDLQAWHVLPGAEHVLAEDIQTEITDTNVVDLRFFRVGVAPE